MKADYGEQEKAFKFLLEKFNSQQLFTLEEFAKAAGWDVAGSTFRTYFSKQFEGLLIKNGASYGVSQLFLKYNEWRKFRDSVVTQKRILRHDYAASSYENVVMFEFFMPLTNEASLRMALDALFFRDPIKFRLKTVNQSELVAIFPKKEAESEEDYFARIFEWISEKFVGYSIGHVAGRFRTCDLKTRKEVYEAAASSNSQLYLVDETTAIVRFIIPCGGDVKNLFVSEARSAQLPLDKVSKLEAEATKIRWFFNTLFVSSILELVNGEDQIWLLESGMHNQLHVWKVKE
jgi:hypothetical protein